MTQPSGAICRCLLPRKSEQHLPAPFLLDQQANEGWPDRLTPYKGSAYRKVKTVRSSMVRQCVPEGSPIYCWICHWSLSFTDVSRPKTESEKWVPTPIVEGCASSRSICSRVSFACSWSLSMAFQFTSGQGDLMGGVKTWRAWLDAFRGSADPRQAAMVSTFEREVLELRPSLPAR